jgi:hypothetical protein
VYFRHPFLRTGPTADVKAELQAFLARQGYRVAPVTIDNSDYMYAALYMRPELLAMLRRRGYDFVTLDDALADAAGLSWIHRWSMTKSLAPKGEPEAPNWVREAFAGLQPAR